MRRDFRNSHYIYCTLFAFIIALSSCKKDHTEVTDPSENMNGALSAGTRTQMTLDSLFLYAKEIYFWNDALPDYNSFMPRNYSSKSTPFNNYEDELYAISQFKVNPATGKPYEFYGDGFPKYSFINDITQANPSVSSAINNKASVDTEGNGNDIGIRAIYYLADETPSSSYSLFVTAVYQNSPAEAAGVKRGWLITKVNGKTVGANIGTEYNTINSALEESSSVTISGVNAADGVPFNNVVLVKGSYKSSPVYVSKVFSKAGKKIGYLSYARFSALSNSDAPSDVYLDPVFAGFSSQGVTDLIIDLRYNGGGYVNTAEYLANLIAPSSVTGKKMFTEIYNATMQSGKATILSHQPLLTSSGKIQSQDGKIITYANLDYSVTAAENNVVFNKKGSLNNVNNVVFIVSRNTASASELLINSLKPYMNVKLVGDTTYGKPVGFFPVILENRYELYMPLFESRNANDEGGYYTGMVPTLSSEFDDPQYPFGDERENYLSLSLNLLAPNVAANRNATMRIGNRNVRVSGFNSRQSKPANPNSEFIGMIEKRHAIKK